jgi:hypothetical protein
MNLSILILFILKKTPGEWLQYSINFSHTFAGKRFLYSPQITSATKRAGYRVLTDDIDR